MNHDDEVRYVLTEQGMRFLASRAGVPQSTFGKHGGVTYTKEADRNEPELAVRHVEHTLGLNRFMVRLAGDAHACGWLLAEWRNEAESTCRFIDQAGRVAWIRPDASGAIAAGEERVPFLVEYDRGTLDASDYHGKFDGYRRYYASEAWRVPFAREPVLLFVCADDRAERRMDQALEKMAADIPAFLTTEWRYECEGTLGGIWRRPREPNRVSFACGPTNRGGLEVLDGAPPR